MSETNLSKEEIIGLKSLKKRIAAGEIIVCETDKSKRFCILTPKQYFESGLKHTKNDIEISPDKVKRVQNFVNDNVNWLREITRLGENWGHSDRMKKNLTDKGEQTCLMTLLMKDHKKWTQDSDLPVPSRPVVSGNSGLNCHLSELVAQIIEAIPYEQSGCEVDSTDYLIDLVKILNDKFKNEENRVKDTQSDSDYETNVPTMSDKQPQVDDKVIPRKFDVGDIRNFGKIGIKTDDSNEKKK